MRSCVQNVDLSEDVQSFYQDVTSTKKTLEATTDALTDAEVAGILEHGVLPRVKADTPSSAKEILDVIRKSGIDTEKNTFAKWRDSVLEGEITAKLRGLTYHFDKKPFIPVAANANPPSSERFPSAQLNARFDPTIARAFPNIVASVQAGQRL